MNAPVTNLNGLPQRVTTGPIHGTRTVDTTPLCRPHIRAPLREIALSDPLEPPVRLYDPSGPYTEADAAIDLAAGAPLVREAWISSRGYAAVAPRPVKPEDNGNISVEKLVPPCPAERTVR